MITLDRMGLVVSRYVTPDPIALLPELRAATERRLGARVKLTITAAVDHLVLANGRTILVRREGNDATIALVRSPWWAHATRIEKARLRTAIEAIGGRCTREMRFTFDTPPRIELIADAIGARVAHRQAPWAYLQSGLRTPVEIELSASTFELQAPILIFGALHTHAVAAAGELAVRVI